MSVLGSFEERFLPESFNCGLAPRGGLAGDVPMVHASSDERVEVQPTATELPFVRQETNTPWRGSADETPLDTRSETSYYETPS
ncbi:hypothetical protein [Rathayibacter sp. AY1F8]|uniref:hypothetical protein n=1 Tax=Rathayibacter sp. AY1F8 TaxID=2080562 RepID=UPI0011B08107|nr:hypothetical protein [Rathayibacter sp. AY1F8]